MVVQLPLEQQRWLEEQVAAGHFASLEEALAVAVSDLMAASEDDLDWARPLVEVGLAEVERGDMVDGDEALARLSAIFDHSR